MPLRLRVVIADDHHDYRRGLARAIDRNAALELVGEAPDGEAALALILEAQPDIAVLDVRMNGVDGLEIARRLHGCAGTHVVLLTGSAIADLRRAAADAGVRQLLSKDLSRDAICAELLRLR